jgi:hypothetical protein
MNAFEAAEKNGRAADLQEKLEDLFNSQNKNSGNGSHLFLRPSCALRLPFDLTSCSHRPMAGSPHYLHNGRGPAGPWLQGRSEAHNSVIY